MNLGFLDKIRLLVVGDIMVDRYLIGTADRISGEAPVPIVRIQREETRAGGVFRAEGGCGQGRALRQPEKRPKQDADGVSCRLFFRPCH